MSDQFLLPSDNIEDAHCAEHRQSKRVARQQWSLVRLFSTLLIDISLSLSLLILYSRAKESPIKTNVFKWIFLLSISRCLLTVVGTWLAIHVGLPASADIKKALDRQRRKLPKQDTIICGPILPSKDHIFSKSSSSFALVRRNRPNNDTEWHAAAADSTTISECLTTPLIKDNTENGQAEAPGRPTSPYVPPRVNGNVLESPKSNKEVAFGELDISEDETIRGLFGSEASKKLDKETQYRRAVKFVETSAHIKRNVVLGVIFFALSVSNFVSCICFVNESMILESVFGGKTFLSLPIHGWLVTGIIIATSYEFFCIRQLVFKSTKDSGILLKSVHPHKLYYQESMEGHTCDNCRRSFRKIHASTEGFRCRVCDFDCCLRCFKLRSLDRGEGILRSDKGPKKVVDYSVLVYLKKALSLSFPFIHWVMLSFLFLVTTQIVGLVLPAYQGKVIDDVFKEDRHSFKHHIKVYAIGSLFTAVLSHLSSVCVQIVQNHLSVGIRIKLLQAVLSQDIAFFDGMMSGQISSRIQSDTQQLVSPCYIILNTGFSNLIMLVGALYMCLNTSWQLTILALCSIGPIVTITNTYATWARPLYSKVWQALGDSNAIANQTIMNIRSVRSFATEEKELSRYQMALQRMLKKGLLNSVVSSVSDFFSRFTELSVGVLVLTIGGDMVMSKSSSLTVGKLVAFQLYWNKMDSAYNSVNNIFNTLIQAASAAERVFSLMECQPDIEKLPRVKKLDTWGRIVHNNTAQQQQPHSLSASSDSKGFQPPCNNISSFEENIGIELKNLKFSYPMRPESQVLKGIDIFIPSGSVCALVGRSGGGKSTLIHLIQRFYDPQEGSISYGGVNLKDIDLQWYRSQIGVVAQDTQLFNISLAENIIYGCPTPVTLAAVIDAAKKACLHDFILTLDEGYETRCGESGGRLSGGQKQRVAIARALLRKPKLLLLDEATSSLDAESEAQVQVALDNLMLEMAGECTILLVAHRLSTVINAHKIFVVDEGRIAESGNHTELLAINGIYAALVQQQLMNKNNEISEARAPNSQQSSI